MTNWLGFWLGVAAITVVIPCMIYGVIYVAQCIF
jgi:hypothetical protein